MPSPSLSLYLSISPLPYLSLSISISVSISPILPHVRLSDTLGNDWYSIILSLFVIVFISGVLIISQVFTALDESREEKRKLKEQNEKIRKEIELNQLNAMQAKLVSAAANNEKQAGMRFLLDWHLLRFIKLLGSGSFGDCYLGEYTKPTRRLTGKSSKPIKVAIKRMRTALVDEKGVKAFFRET